VPARLARSWRLVPALQLTADVRASSADAVILDLEDAVPADAKTLAREAAIAAIAAAPSWVRINDAASGFWRDDLDGLADARGLSGVVLAKVETPEQVARTASRLPTGMKIVALIESARGLEASAAIAQEAATFRLAFGVGDFRRDTGMSDDPIALAYARSRLVIASAAAGIPGPIDGPTVTDTRADLVAAGRHARSMGMTGKLTLREDQAMAINAALSPSSSDIERARDLVGAAHGGSAIDGSYLPALGRARATLALAAAFDL